MKLSLGSTAADRLRVALQRQTKILASKQHSAGETRPAHGRRNNLGMDITWITGRIALGGGIWSAENMAEVARAGITHIVVNAGSSTPSVGASGAIAGVLAAYLRLYPHAQVRTLLLIGPFILVPRIAALEYE